MNNDNVRNLKLLSTTWGGACLALKYKDRLPSDVVEFECKTFFNICNEVNPSLLTELEIKLSDSINFEMGGLSEDILNEIYVHFLKEIGY